MSRALSWVLAVGLVLSACGGSDADQITIEPDTQDTVGESTGATAGGSEQTTPPVVASTTETTATVEAPELAGTSWIVGDYRLPDGVITNVWQTEVTISFSDDGVVSGSAGCNDYEGSWSVSGGWDEFESGIPDPNDGQQLSLDSLSWTETVCDNADIMKQETEILDLLLSAGRWVLIDENFNLRDVEGKFLFEAEPA
jgi:heat shock protein HslJ